MKVDLPAGPDRRTVTKCTGADPTLLPKFGAYRRQGAATSSVCAATLCIADRFAYVGRPVASFTPAALKFVNLDPSRTGGIQEVWASGALK